MNNAIMLSIFLILFYSFCLLLNCPFGFGTSAPYLKITISFKTKRVRLSVALQYQNCLFRNIDNAS